MEKAMNRTFKVVFNQARACLVVANEITRVLKKKGSKTVLAVAALAFIVTPTLAGEASAGEDVTINKTSTTESVTGYYLGTATSESLGSEGKAVNITVEGKEVEGGSPSKAVNLEYGAKLTIEGKTIDITSSGRGLQASENSVLTVGSENTKEFSIDAGSQGVLAGWGSSTTARATVKAQAETITIKTKGNAISLGDNSDVSLKATQKIELESSNACIETSSGTKQSQVSLDAKEISIKSETGYGINVGFSTASTIQIGSEDTELISIESKDNAIFARNQSQIQLMGKAITFASEAADGVIQIQNGTEATVAPDNATSLSITAETLSWENSPAYGFVVFSNSQLNIDANTYIKATKAIDTRGNSTININKDGNKTTQIQGDIVFETPNEPGNAGQSGKYINSHVTINFDGENSFWKGRAYQVYKVEGSDTESIGLDGDASYNGNVTGFSLSFSNKAKWTVSGNSFINSLTLSDGGIVDASEAKTLNVGTWDPTTSEVVAGFKVSGKGNKLTLGEETILNGTIVIADESELITPLSTVFAIEVDEDSSVVTKVTKRLNVETASGATQATLTIPDAFTVSASVLAAINEACGEVAFNLENVTVDLSSTDGESGTSQTTAIRTDITTKSLTGSGNLAINSGKTLTISGENESSDVGTIELGVVESGETGSSTLEIKNQTNVTVSEIKGNGVVLVAENSSVEVETLSGTSKISVGEVNGEGATLSVKNLAMTGGAIFVDPADGFHSTFFVESLASDTLDTNITVGNGGLVVFGSATESEANAAIASVGLSSSTAVVYTTKAATLGSSGSVVIDPTATEADETYAQKLVVRNGGTLVIDQAALNGATVFEGATSVVVADEANFGVVNAAIGTISLGAAVTDESTEGSSATISVYTDSPFLTATLANDTGIITIAGSSDSEGKAVIASLGIQSMIRRADMILAETIADRAAETDPGSNLWVMVRGERYEQDSLGDGAGFHANMGYGAFGAEFAPSEKTNIGLAFQYGHGTVKGDVGSAKNKTKDYSATIYGSALLGDTGIKLLGEVAYTQSSNDITNTYYSGLNQDLDAKMISGGVTLQKRFDFENFTLTPSIGARVSKLKTDAMKLGVNKLDKQSQTIVQVPIALRLAGKTAETENGWSITPRFKVAYIPTFGDKEIDIYGVKKTVLDTSPVQGAFGINFQKGGFSIDATANAGVGNRGTSSIGGKLEMNYRF